MTVAKVPIGCEATEELILSSCGARHPSLVHHIHPRTTPNVTDMKLRHLDADGQLLADFGVLHSRSGGKPLMPDNVNLIGRGE